MRRLSTITFVGMLALTTAGCSSDSEKSSAPTSSAPQPAPKVFDKPPMVNQPLPGAISLAPPVLIQPTNGNQRAKQVQKGRQDPFAGLFAQAGPSVPGTVTIPGTVPGGRQTVPGTVTIPGTVPGGRQPVTVGSGSPRPNRERQNSGSNPSRQPSNPNRGNIGSQASSGQSMPLPPVIPDSSIEPVSPPPPQEPDLASNVAVTGVIQIGNETQAIVQVPNEGTSRYVRVGQRLSNGQVLVKRIEMNEGSEPIVILEQYGIEVARAVGDKPVNSAQTGTSTDGSQVPQPSPNAAETENPAQISTPTDDGNSPVPQPLNNDSAVPTDDGNSPVPQPLNNDSAVPTNTTVPQSVDNNPAVPTDTTVPQPLNNGSAVPTDTTVPQSVDNNPAVPTDTSPVPQSVDNNTDSEL